MIILRLYAVLAFLLTPFLWLLLKRRAASGKELSARLAERRGIASKPRPAGKLIWFHAASVGEAQSALILINLILKAFSDAHVLVTTGTVTSAELMATKLPARAFHQFYPLDQPFWVARFLKHWSPDCVIWMESELWPNMLRALGNKSIPAALMNGRMSASSLKNWSRFRSSAGAVLSAFDVLLVQSEDDQSAFLSLGAKTAHVSGNLKFGAMPLPYDDDLFEGLRNDIGGRPAWLYASTHDGEEALAIDVHKQLREEFPDLLTLIVPRHPERRGDIEALCEASGLAYGFRARGDGLKGAKIYIADTLGELGLFYALCGVSIIGRSFSHDGGGGHNPIEAAQLGSAVLTGPDIQYQREIFDDMLAADAAQMIKKPEDLSAAVGSLLANDVKLSDLQERGRAFVDSKDDIVAAAFSRIRPLLDKALKA